MEWVRKTGPYENGKRLKIGPYSITCVDWDACNSNRELKYKVTILLPGITLKQNHYATEKEAMNVAEQVFEHWIDKAGLQFIPTVR